MRIRLFLFLVPILASSLVWPATLAISAIQRSEPFEYTGDGSLALLNTHTDEIVDVSYKDEKGDYQDDQINEIDYLLRCRLTGEVINIDLKLIELLDYIQDHFGDRRIDVISGYRSPTLNTLLRSRGRGVASRSYHMRGKAIDIRIPGIDSRKVRDFALSLKSGGVGYYAGPDFVHIDVGPVRRW